MSQIPGMEGAPGAEHAIQQDEALWAAVAAHAGGAVLAPMQMEPPIQTDYYQPYDVPPGQRLNRLTTPEGKIAWGLARAVGYAALQETRFQTHEERCLTEVDHLLLHRQMDGTYPPDILDAMHINNLTRVREPAMPFAVSTTFQEYVDGEFWWRRQNSLQVGASGYRYYKHEQGLQRGDVEVVEAIFADERLQPGQTSVMFTARMSAKDASQEVAKHEHLADDDSIRIQWLAHNPDGSIRGKYVQSILVRSDLRKAWVAMLADPNNLFGKAIAVEDPDSALSLMKAFTETQIDSSKLPEGVVTLLEATLPYIADAEQRKEVLAMVPEYRNNQLRMQQVAEDIATRWDEFDLELANSLATERATTAITRFIDSLGHQWNDDDLKLFARHQIAPGQFRMSRELAVRLEKAQESILCAQAALLVGNKRALRQVTAEAAAQIIAGVERLHDLRRMGLSVQQIMEQERLITAATAIQDIQTDGGCAGSVSGNFRNNPEDGGSGTNNRERSLMKDRHGSRTFNCPTCQQKNERNYEDFVYFCQHCTKKIPRCGPAEADKKKEDTALISAAQALAELLQKAKKSNLAPAA